MVILVKNKADGLELTRVNLPGFCISHMKNTAPEENLKMLLGHINRGIQIPRSKLYIRGEIAEKLFAEDVQAETTIVEVD